MALLRGKLFAGALFAGALFGSVEETTAPQMSGGYYRQIFDDVRIKGSESRGFTAKKLYTSNGYRLEFESTKGVAYGGTLDVTLSDDIALTGQSGESVVTNPDVSVRIATKLSGSSGTAASGQVSTSISVEDVLTGQSGVTLTTGADSVETYPEPITEAVWVTGTQWKGETSLMFVGHTVATPQPKLVPTKFRASDYSKAREAAIRIDPLLWALMEAEE